MEMMIDKVAEAAEYELMSDGIVAEIEDIAINTSFNRSMDANTNIGHVWGILIASAVLLLVWSLPNYIYFKHRKFLFEGNLTKNNTSSNEKVIMNKVEPSIVISSENQGVDNQTTNSMNRPKSAEKPVIDSIHMSKTKNSESAIPVEDLRALKELYDSGIVTKEEFEEKKAQLLEL